MIKLRYQQPCNVTFFKRIFKIIIIIIIILNYYYHHHNHQYCSEKILTTSLNDRSIFYLISYYYYHYGLRVLKKAGMSTGDLVSVYRSIVRSTVEYVSPAWVALPQYLRNMLESVQKQAMRVIFSGFLYEDALDLAGLDPLYVLRVDSCKSFVIKAKKVLRVIYSPNVVEHDRNLRSGNKTVYPTLGRTARLNNFVTVKYQC